MVSAMALVRSVSAVEKADVRNAALFTGQDDGSGRWAEVFAVDLAAEQADGFVEVVGFVFDGGEEQFAANVERHARDFFVEVGDDQLVDAARRGFAGAAETVRQTGQGHQFEHDVFEDVAGPGAFLEAAQEAAILAVVAAVLDEAR